MFDVPERLWSCPPFSDLDAPSRVELLNACEELEFAAGAEIYLVGEEAEGLYVLLSGSISLADPSTSVVGGVSPHQLDEVGTLLSRASILEVFAHRHACRAETDVRVLLLRREAFEERFARGSGFALRLLDHVVRVSSAEVRELNHAIHAFLSDH